MNTFFRAAVLAAASLVAVPAMAQPVGWTELGGFAVTDNAGGGLNNFVVPYVFDGAVLVANGQARADGGDLRFAIDSGGSEQLQYWVDGSIDTPTARVWVHLPAVLPNGTAQVYVFAGNPAATDSGNVELAFAGNIFQGNGGVSDSNAGGVTNSQRGFRFAVNEDLLLLRLGRKEPNGTARTITLFDFNTQAILRQEVVSGPAAQYSYGTLQPLWLTQATQYTVQQHQGDSDGYYFGAAPTAGPGIAYLDMRYCNGCTANSFPTNVLNNIHYGYVDFLYARPPQTTPAPTLRDTHVDLAIGMDNGVDDIAVGQPFTWTIVVANVGIGVATDAQVSFVPPPEVLKNLSFSATATGGASGYTPAGTGSIADTVTLPLGSSITYSYTAQLTTNAGGALVGTATVTAAGNQTEVSGADNTASDSDTILGDNLFSDGLEDPT